MSKLLNGRYSIDRKISEGGFGHTFLAADTQHPDNRQCVVKKFEPSGENASQSTLIFSYFQKEADVLKKLGEEIEGVPKLYDYFEEAGEYYLVQEYIEGRTLKQRIEQDGVFNEEYARKFLESFLPILEKVHIHVIHRDINPNNIVLRKQDDAPVLIDFGAVKHIVTRLMVDEGSGIGSTIIGTPGYMPPEQVAGKDVFPSSDIYSLGATIIYTLTGKKLHQFTDEGGRFQWEEHCSQISQGFATFLNKTIESEHPDRYQSAREMFQALCELTIVRYYSTKRHPMDNILTEEAKKEEWKESTLTIDHKKTFLPSGPPPIKTKSLKTPGSKTLIWVLAAFTVSCITLVLLYWLSPSQQENGNAQNKKVTIILPEDVSSPSAVFRKIEKAQEVTQRTVAKDFIGYQVNWTLYFISLSYTEIKSENLFMLELREVPEKASYTHERGAPTVFCTVDLSEYRKLAWVKTGDPIPVRGNISNIRGIGTDMTIDRKMTLDPVVLDKSFRKVD